MEAQYLSVPVYLLGGIVFFVSSFPHQCCGTEKRTDIAFQVAAIMGDKYKLRGTVSMSQALERADIR
jgi:hypothetical protein